jgi:hypothetical protein
MKYSYAFVAVFAVFAVAHAADDDCVVACPMIYDPVCGTDGTQFKTFSNRCMMENADCKKTKWHETRMALCEPEVARTSCLRPCQTIYAPVCATNGARMEMFDNSCLLEVRNCEENNKWRLTKMSECEQKIEPAQKKTNPCLRACPFIYKPVCAYNGDHYEMFDNDCVLEERNCEDNNVWRLTKMASCAQRTEPKKNCLRACPYIYDPVCAVNGARVELFANSCLLEEQNCEDNNQWRLTKLASCTQRKNCIQACPMNYLPVCGFDGTKYETFSNECVYQSKNCLSNYSWKLVKAGEC